MKNIVKAVERKSSGKERQWVWFLLGEFPTDKHGETQDWYFWRLSNKITYKEPNIWWSNGRIWIVRLAVTEVSGYKLPGKSLECAILRGNRNATEEFLPTRGTIVSQTALSSVTLRLFSQDLVIRIMEERYQGRWEINFLADYCKCLTRGLLPTKNKRKSLKIPFIHE